jgi:cell division protein FtsI (penicillin-binding protein 3)
MFVFLGAIAIRVSDLQVFKQSELAERAERTVTRAITIPAQRGTITDRNGTVLAMDVDRHSLYVVPDLVPEKERAALAATLAGLLNLPIDDILPALSDPKSRWRLIQRGLAPETAKAVRELEEPALRMIFEPQRVYPQGELAAHVIGGVNGAGDGLGGVEAFYQRTLRGATGVITAEVDPLNQPIPLRAPQQQAVRDGADLQLTLDLPLQVLAEEALRAAIETQRAESGTVLVMDVRSGALRAIANYPTYDPNNYMAVPPERYSLNPALGRVYEPGSTFKILTLAAGLQSGAFNANTQVADTGVINYYGWQLGNWNRMGNGNITPGGMLYFSSNVGSIRLNELTGKTAFYETVRAFGFGQPLGVDLSGEAGGIVPDPRAENWSPIQLGTNSYGQGLAATPLQIVHMAAIIGNDGVPVRPRIVERVCNEGGCVQEAADAGPAVVSPGVARAIREMLVQSGNHYVNPAKPDRLWLVPGYAVGAKTGTSSIPDGRGGYEDNATIGSVVGLVPADQPRYALLVVVHRPQKDLFGLQAAVPVFRTVAAHLARESDVPPDESKLGPGQRVAVVE